MSNVSSAVIQANAARVLNSQPHFDDLKNDLKEMVMDPRVPDNEKATMYCLPHHHFKLKPGEVLLFEVHENVNPKLNTIKVSTGAYEEGMYPFQYYSDGNKYVPVGFTRQKMYECKQPMQHFPHLGVISVAAFLDGMEEYTDEDQRIQVFNKKRLDGVKGKEVVTMMQKVGGEAGKCTHCTIIIVCHPAVCDSD